MSSSCSTSGDLADLVADCQSEAEVGRSAGFLLKKAREASGLKLSTLATSLKVPLKKLEALEQDRFDLLPDVVFARALAGSVCRSLKLDAREVLQRIPNKPSSVLSGRELAGPEGRLAVPIRSARRRSHAPVFRRSARRAPTIGLVLLAVAVALVYFADVQGPGHFVKQALQGRLSDGFILKGNDSRVGPTAGTSMVMVPNGMSAGGGSTVLVRAGSHPIEPVFSLDHPVSPISRTTDRSGAAIAPTPSPGQSRQSMLPRPETRNPIATPVLTLIASGDAWVSVTDAKGAVLLNRLFAAGEVVQTSGLFPLKTVLGRADLMRVEVRGRSLDLAPLSRENVARFEVQ
ncbi:MAG: DUF4115 domain-containing protein [Polaromonas sp.]|nr:DUF4115 domain-containing protein [Polaromonas sp.]